MTALVVSQRCSFAPVGDKNYRCRSIDWGDGAGCMPVQVDPPPLAIAAHHVNPAISRITISSAELIERGYSLVRLLIFALPLGRDAAKSAVPSRRSLATFSTPVSLKGLHRSSAPRANSLLRHYRCDVVHEALHRLEELVKVVIAVEVDLEGIEAGFFTVAQ